MLRRTTVSPFQKTISEERPLNEDPSIRSVTAVDRLRLSDDRKDTPQLAMKSADDQTCEHAEQNFPSAVSSGDDGNNTTPAVVGGPKDPTFSPLTRNGTESTANTSSSESLKILAGSNSFARSPPNQIPVDQEHKTFTLPEGSILYHMPPLLSPQQTSATTETKGGDEINEMRASFDSNLSLRDMFTTSDDGNHEYFAQNEDDETEVSDDRNLNAPYDTPTNRKIDPNHYTPPTSLNTTPTKLFSKQGGAEIASSDVQNADPLMLPATTSAAQSIGQSTAASLDVASAASLSSNSVSAHQQHRKPVLYSAIGSLEDPSSSSYKGWKNEGAATNKKFEFPSTMLLAPPAQVKASQKKKNMIESVQSQLSKPDKGDLGKQVFGQGQKQQEAVNKKPSSLRKPKTKDKSNGENLKSNKTVTIVNDETLKKSRKARRPRQKKEEGPVEMFRPSSDAYTPRMGKKTIKYKPAEMRTPVQEMASPLGTLSRPNFRDALRRVAMILHQHIVKIERRFEGVRDDHGLFCPSMKDAFSEEKFITPKYKCTMVRVPMARSGMVCGLKRVRDKYEIPSEGEIYEFAHSLFKTVQLSSECSIVCLIYIERLMEASRVPLLANTWRPIFLCGLLLASKVWQDLSSWNIEFASVYPQYSLDSINRLELMFLQKLRWDLYISSSQYAKYYFALRSLTEKSDFRQRYNRMVGGVNMVQADQARQIEERSTQVKKEALLQLSRSM